MSLSFIQPRPELERYIRSLWIFDGPAGLPLSEKSIVAPNGSPKLIVSCENPIISEADGAAQVHRDRDLYLVGIRDIPVLLHTEPRPTRFIGIEFYPNTAYPFLGVPMVELTNSLIPLAELLPEAGSAVSDTILSIANVEAKADFVQALLARRIQESAPGSPIVDFCVAAIKEQAGLFSVSQLEERTGYTRRYLEMLFSRHVGISPKSLARIVRFQSLYARWSEAQCYEELIDRLYDSYYDQAHFAKEFKRMTGFSPLQFTRVAASEFSRRMTLR